MSVKKLKYIVIEGSIGVGKTTLTNNVAADCSAHAYLEIVEDNPFLVNGFYEDIETNAFNTELFFLLARFRQQRKISKHLQTSQQLAISDYLFQKNAIFASLTLNREDFQIFSSVFAPLNKLTPTPDLVVHLRADVPTLLKRIRLRDRKFERDIQEEYLSKLLSKYDAFFETYTDTPVITIDASSIDFVQETKDYSYILDCIQKHCEALPLKKEGQQSLTFKPKEGLI